VHVLWRVPKFAEGGVCFIPYRFRVRLAGALSRVNSGTFDIRLQ